MTNPKFKFVWDQYSDSRPVGSTHTERYFKKIPAELQTTFSSSTNQIIQLGCNSGAYLRQLNLTRRVIGYDYSKRSLDFFSAERALFSSREIDLEQIEDGNLSYAAILQRDLLIVSDILIVRTLEYLDPKAVELLLFSLILHLKPGSRIDIEIFNAKGDAHDHLTTIGFCGASTPQNYIATFFSSRTDFVTLYHSYVHNEVEDQSPNISESTVERLIYRKI